MKALVVLSGGQDSTTCLALAIQKYGLANVYGITFDYGQRHDAEVDAASHIAKIAGIYDERYEIVKCAGILKGTSPLVNEDAQVETYASAEALPGGLEKTFVPMRNQFFLTVAANRAVDIGLANIDAQGVPAAVDIITGVSQEDYGGYPDCRKPFTDSLTSSIRLSLSDKDLPWITIQTPLMTLDKQATVNLALAIDKAGVPVQKMLAYSHTCYNGKVPPCGECHACLLREKGFRLAGVNDPLVERLLREAVQS